MLSIFYTLLKTPFYTFKYRDRHTIIVDMLKAIAKSRKGSRKTQIMQRANLNSNQLNKYIDILLRNGFVIIEGYRYKLSSKGLKFLENVESDVLKVQWRR